MDFRRLWNVIASRIFNNLYFYKKDISQFYVAGGFFLFLFFNFFVSHKYLNLHSKRLSFLKEGKYFLERFTVFYFITNPFCGVTIWIQ